MVKIPKDLIKECNDLSEKKGEIHFIFDTKTKTELKSFHLDKKEKREAKIDSVLGKKRFYISTEKEFDLFQSRFSYYDSETKCECQYKRYDQVHNFIKKLGFTPSKFNLGRDYEQSYQKFTDNYTYIVRLKTNMFLSIEYFEYDRKHVVYDGFFNKSKIIDNLLKLDKSFTNIIRDIKIDGVVG